MSKESKLTFLRQSGWVAFATTIGGAASYAVHTFAKDMPKAEYGEFTTSLQLINLFAIPGIGLQTVFAQKFAAAHTDKELEKTRREKNAVASLIFISALIVFATVWILCSTHLRDYFHVGLGSLLILGLIGAFALWLPIECGTVQGRQNFKIFGFTMLALGLVRLITIPIFFRIWGANAFVGVLAVCAGYCAALIIAARGEPNPKNSVAWRDKYALPDWRNLFKRFLPLSLGGGAIIFMMSIDMVIVQKHFDEKQTGLYAAAGMIGRSLIFLMGPLVAVMFPKIVRSHVGQKPTDVLKLTLMITAGLCIVAGSLGILLPKLPLQIIYDKSYLAIAPLVPWFIWAMVPLALATVLVNNLLAQKIFPVVYGLVSVNMIYAATLWYWAPEFAAQTEIFNVNAYISVAKLIGLGNLAFLSVATGFTWWHHRSVTNAAEEH